MKKIDFDFQNFRMIIDLNDLWNINNKIIAKTRNQN